MRDSIKVKINALPGPIPTQHLSSFLYLFRAAYVSGLESGYDYFPNGKLTEEAVQEAVAEISRHISGLSKEELSRLANKKLSPDFDLGIEEIVRENPIRASFSAAALALAAAVILSGGEYELGPLKVDLPPLGEGIERLRAAFGNPENDHAA